MGMVGLALIGMAVGAVTGTLSSIADVDAQNAADTAQATQNASDAAELERQLEAGDEIFTDQMEDAALQQAAADRAAQFNIGETEIKGERAVGSQVAQNAASGLGGASKVGVVDQLASDYDRQIAQMEADRQEMLRATTAQMDIAQLEHDEGERQTEREIDLLTGEAEDLLGFDAEGNLNTEVGRDSADRWQIFTGALAGM